MKLASLTIEIYIPAANSLKDKRSVVKSLIEKCSYKYNISISEVDKHELWRRSVIGIAMISNEYKIIEKTFQQIINDLDTINELELMKYNIDYY